MPPPPARAAPGRRPAVPVASVVVVAPTVRPARAAPGRRPAVPVASVVVVAPTVRGTPCACVARLSGGIVSAAQELATLASEWSAVITTIASDAVAPLAISVDVLAIEGPISRTADCEYCGCVTARAITLAPDASMRLRHACTPPDALHARAHAHFTS